MQQNTGDILRDLDDSTRKFYQRFGVTPALGDCVQNLREEVAELIDAAHKGAEPAHIAEEAADVFVTTLGVCYAMGIDMDTLIAQIGVVIAKNDAKTHHTHVYADGKIRRRPM
jgi:NTP pyrophosphatase (non-canonical NTP hydrolase)